MWGVFSVHVSATSFRIFSQLLMQSPVCSLLSAWTAVKLCAADRKPLLGKRLQLDKAERTHELDLQASCRRNVSFT